jgi:hypothetical protein
MSERQLQEAVLELAGALGYRAYHTYDSRRSQPGFPDLVLVRPPDRIVFAELKGERGRISREQASWLSDLHLVELSINARCAEEPFRVQVWKPEQWRDGSIVRKLR